MAECPFWTPDLCLRAAKASTFEALAEVAVQVLESMPAHISQLCGPISTGGLGDEQKNSPLFARCVAELRRRELNPFDQMPLQDCFDRLVLKWRETNSGYCYPILEVVYRRIFESGYVKRVFLLPGWDSSRGATWEHGLVRDLGIEINNFPLSWYEMILAELGYA